MLLDIFTLIKLAKEGDKSAGDEIVKNNSALVWSVAKRFSNRGCEADDLFQIGCIGLMKAVWNFNFDLNVKFSTYAVPMIMGEIKRFLRDDGIIKVSRSLKVIAAKARGIGEEISHRTGADASIGEIAAILGVSPEEVVMAMSASERPESIYQTAYQGQDSEILLIDKLQGDFEFDDDVINRVALKTAMSTLAVRDRQILVLRYFKNKTQSEIAGMLGISQVQVSRIEKKLLERLRAEIV